MSVSESTRIGLGVIGCGTAARLLHGPAIQQSNRITVRGLFDLKAEAARLLTGQFPEARLYDWTEELLEDPAVDAVAILTPPASHAALAEAAIRAGKHLLLEAPVALSASDAWELAKLARDAGLVCAVGYHLRQHRLVQRVRNAIASRRLGRVGAVHSVWSSSAFQRVPSDSWRCHDRLGGNLLHELSVHHLDLWRFLLREELHALHAERLEVGQASTRVQLVTRSFSGVLVHTTLIAANLDCQEIEIVGDRGRVSFSLQDAWSYREEMASSRRSSVSRQLANWRMAAAELPEGIATQLRGGDLAASFRAQWDSFAEAVILGGTPAATLDDGYLSLELVERAYGISLRQIDLQPSAEPAPPDAGTVPVPQDRFAAGGDRTSPSLSIVFATPNPFDDLKPALAHLRGQRVLGEIELVLVTPARNPFEVDPLWMEGFHSWQVLRPPRMPPLPTGYALGVRHARADLVVMADDHSFPDPDWAEALLTAHRAGHAAVGFVLRNANPETAISWADFLVSSSHCLHGIPGGASTSLAGLTCCYRRSALLNLGDDLEPLLEAADQLPGYLRQLGHTLHLEPRAVVARVNFALFDSWIAAAFFRGRVFAGNRTESWNALKRLAYWVVAAPLPYLRIVRILAAMQHAGYPPLAMLRALPHLWLGLTVESMGQVLGYATGTGSADQALAHYEWHRSRHVPPTEREWLFERFKKS